MTNTNLKDQCIALFDNKEYKRAEDCFRKLLKSEEPDFNEIKFRLAFCLEMQEKYEEAESFYIQAGSSESPPELTGDAFYRVGWMAMGQKDHSKAIHYFQRASEVLKESLRCQRIYRDSVYWLAISYEAAGQIIKAIKVYKQIENDPFWYRDVCYRKIKCYDKIGLYREALECCMKFEADYKPETAVKRATELYREIKKIKDQLTEILEYGSGNTPEKGAGLNCDF